MNSVMNSYFLKLTLVVLKRMRRNEEEATSIAQKMEVEEERERGRPRKRWKDCIKKDMEVRRLKREDVWERSSWRTKIRVADSRTVWD